MFPYPIVDISDPETDRDTLFRTSVCAYDPTTDFGIAAFIADYFTSSIPSKVTLCDRVGNRFEVAIEYKDGYLYMCEGWKKLGPYYKLEECGGGYIQLTYYEDSTFLMSVKDRLYEDTSYVYFGLSGSV